jgi:hypothetical protein
MASDNQPITGKGQQVIYKVPFSYILISSDVILRFICLWMYKSQNINDWLFWLSQIIFIPLLEFFIFMFTNSQAVERIKKSKLLNEKFTLEVEGNAQSVIFCLTAFAIGIFTSWTLFADFTIGMQIFLITGTIVVYGFYIWVLSSISFGRVKNENSTRKEEHKNQNYPEIFSVDGNDEKLVELEISLTQFSNKVDTYTLESAVLGALSFSGFLAILSLDNSVVNNIQILLSQFSAIFNSLIDLNFNILPLPILNQQTIISLLAIELIICSFFFLLVIVSRIRFHDTLCEAELYIKTSRELNNKEEEYDIIYHQSPSESIKERLAFLSAEITKKLNIGTKRKKELESIINYLKSANKS